jgi:hypothetical protein
MIHLPYQTANPSDKEIDTTLDSWNVVGADALVDYFPDVGKALFFSGSRVIWFPGHPVGQYAKLLNHTVMSGWGHRTMAAIVESGPGALPAGTTAAPPGSAPSPGAPSHE